MFPAARSGISSLVTQYLLPNSVGKFLKQERECAKFFRLQLWLQQQLQKQFSCKLMRSLDDRESYTGESQWFVRFCILDALPSPKGTIAWQLF
jgi:hypothetical protein